MKNDNNFSITHIPGFDNLLNGGIPKGSNVLLSGSAGTGKTIWSLEYLYNGAVKEKEVGIYFTFEEKKESLIEQAAQFGWDLLALEKKGKLKIISLGINDINKVTVDEILEIIKNTNSKRIIIDSITTLAFLTPISSDGDVGNLSIKKFLYTFMSRFKEIGGITTIFISQKDQKTSNTIAEYLCDGIINIEYESLGGDYSRHLTVRKMRKVKHDEDLHPLEICAEGVVVHDLE